MSAHKLPVVYVRGFAATSSEIDDAVDDPLYGFNKGAVHVRIGSDDKPWFHQFEGPLLRLISDERYQLLVHGDQRAFLLSQEDAAVPEATVWIHRFYDQAATTFGAEPAAFVLEDAAEDLFDFVKLVLTKTGAPRVFLVAHSMGGLICRSMIQRVIPLADGAADAATSYVDRLFTYGTPHSGIQFAHGFGLLEKLRDLFNIDAAAIFGPDRMYEYLTTDGGNRPNGWSPADVPDGVFPKERIFCLVGTDSEDYAVARGLSSKLVGVRSDGLVQIDRAFVPGANRALVHRSHSGRYGLVNSEEGYQNLRRFLFGDLRAQVDLVHVEPPPGSGDDGVIRQVEVQLAIRQLPVLVDERTSAHHCPIQFEPTPAEDPVLPLLVTFLTSRLPRPTDTLRYSLHLRLLSLAETGLELALDPANHLEQTADFDDTLVVDVQPGNGDEQPAQAWAVWNSELPGAIRNWTPTGDPLPGDQSGDGWMTEVALPETANPLFGPTAAIRLTLTPWQ
ncbi:hypothetical protein DMA12_41950 [Amycolatopsis balhimycina DSM 5908]|uniref:Alpha/beta hydrolase n=1 Tax=Amycolatopsis balhimycina DSM 5908 TaxID=1081091 RepID=A0A428VYZ4_AMYBA|nr:LigA protein [Amycolatopsis balhimycina]RSM36042.1 hypothetical protein DMA12_41950 [Amycolatopsis balhimycina DSM 5908]